MKKLCIGLMAALLALTPTLACAQNSRGNADIPETRVMEVVPEDETQEVVPPEVKIVPDTEEIMNLQEDVQAIFQLTIYYVYVDGSTAAAPYSSFLFTGDAFSVASPDISGYSTTMPQVTGNMPARNLVYTVVYMSPGDENPVFRLSDMRNLYSIGDYEVPLGLGFTSGNLGICFE